LWYWKDTHSLRNGLTVHDFPHFIRCRPERPFVELAARRPRQKRLVDIGAENPHVPRREPIRKLLLQENGDAVGLGPDGATSRPDSQRAAGLVSFDELRQDDITKRIELLRMAEKVGLADRQLTNQEVALRLASLAVLQQIQVSAAAFQRELREPSTDPGSQVAVFVHVIRKPGRFDEMSLERWIIGIQKERMYGGRNIHDGF
jgi:hypothetical protein